MGESERSITMGLVDALGRGEPVSTSDVATTMNMDSCSTCGLRRVSIRRASRGMAQQRSRGHRPTVTGITRSHPRPPRFATPHGCPPDRRCIVPSRLRGPSEDETISRSSARSRRSCTSVRTGSPMAARPPSFGGVRRCVGQRPHHDGSDVQVIHRCTFARADGARRQSP